MSNNHKEFLALLTAGLWNKEPHCEALQGMTAQSWNSVFKLAVSGTVVMLCFEAVCRLPRNLQPPRELLLRWLALSEQKQQHNRHCREVLANISDIYGAEGVEFILLKGIGVASLYHNELLRDGGDIDLLITKGYDTANQVLIPLGGTMTEKNIKHNTINYRGISIENHCQVAMVPSISDMFAELFAVDNQVIQVEDRQVRLPGATCNSLYLTQHIAMHFFSSGIGLRHLCDLCLLFAKHSDQIDKEFFVEKLTKTGTLELFKRLAAVMCSKLGLDEACLPVIPVFDKYTDKIYKDIIDGGNFGFHGGTRKVASNKFVKKVNTMNQMVNRCYEYRKIGTKIYSQQIKEMLIFTTKSFFGR